MKKVLIILLLAISLAGCGSKKEENKLVIVATEVPHAEVLREAAKILKEKGITLDIKVTDDYYLPNKAVNDGSADANYFQHVPFLEGEIEAHGYQLVNVANIHIEPIGIYSNKYSNVSEIEDGATLIMSNSVADHGRILAVLEHGGLITLNPAVEKRSATIEDIVANPKNIQFRPEIAPELLATSYKNNEADLVAINSNYALNAGLNPLKDSVIIEANENNPYINLVAVKAGNENNANILALVEALKSAEITSFIEEKYQGSVIVAK